jgi:hypothetical protein
MRGAYAVEYAEAGYATACYRMRQRVWRWRPLSYAVAYAVSYAVICGSDRGGGKRKREVLWLAEESAHVDSLVNSSLVNSSLV